jgi:O-antigen/teichoic acid export membrane protein
MRQVLLISFVSAVVLALLSPVAVPLAFGESFRASVPVIWWILPGTVALALGKVAASDLAGRHKTGFASAFGVVALGVTMGLDFVLIPRWGIRGAAMASSAAYLTSGVLFLAALRKELRVNWGALLVPGAAEWGQYRQLILKIAAWIGVRRAS